MKIFSYFEKFFKKAPVVKKDSPAELIQTAKVLDIEKHPNADRLVVARVQSGVGEVYPVVCGAKNFKIGDIVVLALPGARIAQNIHSAEHEPFTLEKAKIRGVESQGMLCAEFELGLSADPGSGIAVLPLGTPIGVDPIEILENK